MARRIDIYDTTLRDGAQGPGVKFSSDDQLQVVRVLDALGIRYIEGGQPGSNPKAVELFARARDMELTHAKMAAFGSTRNPKSAVEDDANIKALLSAGTEVVTIFAKSSPSHAQEVLRVSLDENLKLVEESVSYLKAQGRRVFLDGEHFFDGYFEDNEYAMSVPTTIPAVPSPIRWRPCVRARCTSRAPSTATASERVMSTFAQSSPICS